MRGVLVCILVACVLATKAEKFTSLDVDDILNATEKLASEDIFTAARGLQTLRRLVNDESSSSSSSSSPLTVSSDAKEVIDALLLEIEIRKPVKNDRVRKHALDNPQLTASARVRGTRAWFSLNLRAGNMTEIEELKWSEGDCQFTVAKTFCKRYLLDETIFLRPLYNAMVDLENEKLKRPRRLSAPPPWDVPEPLFNAYTLNGVIPVTKHYRDDAVLTSFERRPYSFPEIERYILAASRRKVGYYGDTDHYLYASIRQAGGIQNKSVLIVGSLQPWYEAICLSFGARECVSVEYHELHYRHPSMKTLTPGELEAALSGEEEEEGGGKKVGRRERFDTAFVISSFEHNGLGRYGDPLDPDGDIMAMNDLQRWIRDDAIAFLAVPCGPDKLVWNAHRVYGRLRLPLLLQNWSVLNYRGLSAQLLDVEPENHHQPVFTIQNTRPKIPWTPPTP